ncbi:GIP [Symbiodinium microadriaticum]|nr:GIP [Symbiodinium microadriaticum]
MTKTELLSEANRLGLAPSARWTVEELKSAIMEAKKDLNEDTTVPKGMSGMKLAELKAEADRIGVMYASGVTRGTLMRHIRDYHETPDNTVMNIGRYRGSAYFQVPLSYAQWADQEERANGVNMSPDLKRFVLWFRRKKAKEATGNGPTRAEMMQEPEKYAKVPYPGGSETSQSWENVTVMNEVDKQQRPFIPESSGAKSMASSSTSGKRTAERPNTKERMSVEPDPNVLDEIRALEQRLALLKDKESKPEDPTENVDYKNNVENKHVENHFDYQRDDYNLSDATGEDELSFDDYDAEVLLTECTEDAIHNAIKSNDYTPQRLLHLLQEVFGKDGEHFPRRGARKRTRAFGAGDLGENRIVLGYYTYGSMRGICNNSSKYASLSIYIKNYFLSRSADAKWSSLSISLNSASRVHSDHNNLKGTGNYITTVGDYTNGGGIWTENKDGNYDQRFLDGKGNKVKGIIQDTYGKVVEFEEPLENSHQGEYVHGVANDYKIGKDTALLEIGGMTQTLDATTVFERITGEPLLWPDIPTNHAGSYVLKYILELNPRMLWLHPPTGYTGEDERKFFEVLDICGRWQVEQQRALVVSVDGADPDLLQRLQKQLSAYGDVSYSILGEENIFRVHRTEPKQAYVAEGGIGGGSILRSPDEAQHRREIIRNAARIAFYKTRTEEKIRRGLSQRARIKPRDLENGATVFFWRKPASKKYGIWKGPGVVIGRQHENYWISHGGRCYLCAPEHLRCALPEELGGLFALRATKDDLLRLVDQSYDDVGVFAEDEGEDMEEYAPSFVDEGEAPMELDNIDLENGDGEDTRPTPLRRAAEGELPREDTHHEAMILKRSNGKNIYTSKLFGL